jgi:hypothetical protein
LIDFVKLSMFMSADTHLEMLLHIALSDPSQIEGEPGPQRRKEKQSTRAAQLREQKTRAELIRMDSLVRPQNEVTMYTSKTLIGAAGR